MDGLKNRKTVCLLSSRSSLSQWIFLLICERELISASSPYLLLTGTVLFVFLQKKCDLVERGRSRDRHQVNYSFTISINDHRESDKGTEWLTRWHFLSPTTSAIVWKDDTDFIHDPETDALQRVCSAPRVASNFLVLSFINNNLVLVWQVEWRPEFYLHAGKYKVGQTLKALRKTLITPTSSRVSSLIAALWWSSSNILSWISSSEMYLLFLLVISMFWGVCLLLSSVPLPSYSTLRSNNWHVQEHLGMPEPAGGCTRGTLQLTGCLLFSAADARLLHLPESSTQILKTDTSNICFFKSIDSLNGFIKRSDEGE